MVYANGTDWPGLLAGLPPNRGILGAVAADGSHELWHFDTPFSPNASGVAAVIALGRAFTECLHVDEVLSHGCVRFSRIRHWQGDLD